jgi:predicted nucleotidyltransferase
MDSLIASKRNDILRVAARHGAGNVRVFGSRSRGDARPDSDVDLLFDIVGPTTPWFPGGLIADLQSLLGIRVDAGMESELHEAIRDRAKREAVAL